MRRVLMLPISKQTRKLAESVLSISKALRSFFETHPDLALEEAPRLRNAAKNDWIKAKEGASSNSDKTELAIALGLHRIGEESYFAILESSEFKTNLPVEARLAVRSLERTVQNILEALRPEGVSIRLVSIKKYASDVVQICKKARRDALKDAQTVRGLKQSEIFMRFSEAAEIAHKIADSLGEALAA